MTIPDLHCNPEGLHLLLEGSGNSESYQQAAEHLESCAACQQRLLDLSSDADFRQLQREMLQPQPGDPDGTGTLSRFHSTES
ncbi:MAG: hypothetical protein KDA85_16580, partial [Planctomycetaceae bacterium]|nr:hypothetical protein [Planctomycetaceae bacterium]